MQNSNSLSVQKNNSLAENEEKNYMTTKELAQVLGVTPRTIQQVVDKLGLAKLISQVKIRGKMSYSFNQEQATAIKIELQNHTKVAKNGYNTLSIANDLEAWELQKRLDAYKDRRIAELTAENEKKQAILDTISNAKGCFSIAQAAKALQLPYGRNTLKDNLKKMDLLIEKTGEPYQSEINAGHFKVKNKVCADGVNRPVSLITGKGLVYLAKKFNTTIDESILPDAE